MTAVRSVVDNGIGRITLDRAGRMNAVNIELSTELGRAIVDLGNDPAVNVIVIRGAGGNFCAGGDFAEVERLTTEGPDALRALFAAFRHACDAIAQVEIPVVVAVEGVAMAGGFELMQAADIVLVSADARISDNHIKFGMIPGGGSTQQLPRLVGRQQAMGLLLSGDRLSGDDAVRLGLAYRSFAQQGFEQDVEQFLADLAGRQRSSVIAIKRLVRDGLDSTLTVGLDHEMDSVVKHISGGVGRHGAAAFNGRTEKK